MNINEFACRSTRSNTLGVIRCLSIHSHRRTACLPPGRGGQFFDRGHLGYSHVLPGRMGSDDAPQGLCRVGSQCLLTIQIRCGCRPVLLRKTAQAVVLLQLAKNFLAQSMQAAGVGEAVSAPAAITRSRTSSSWRTGSFKCGRHISMKAGFE